MGLSLLVTGFRGFVFNVSFELLGGPCSVFREHLGLNPVRSNIFAIVSESLQGTMTLEDDLCTVSSFPSWYFPTLVLYPSRRRVPSGDGGRDSEG